MANYGNLFVVSAPSGAGKHTILNEAMKRCGGLAYAVTATTREPREGEVNGRDYHFLERGEFERRVAAGDFVEWAEVHGNLYGVLKEELETRRASGQDVVIQMDVQGMRNMTRAGFDIVSVFIVPPSVEELERRLTLRATDAPEAMAVRLKNAEAELAAKNEYDHIVVNDEIEQAVAAFEAIVCEQRRHCDRRNQESMQK
ncbi:MAG: guanylate kinase [bacterium]|nr:guanylate kinase [bacterium]